MRTAHMDFMQFISAMSVMYDFDRHTKDAVVEDPPRGLEGFKSRQGAKALLVLGLRLEGMRGDDPTEEDEDDMWDDSKGNMLVLYSRIQAAVCRVALSISVHPRVN